MASACRTEASDDERRSKIGGKDYGKVANSYPVSRCPLILTVPPRRLDCAIAAEVLVWMREATTQTGFKCRKIAKLLQEFSRTLELVGHDQTLVTQLRN